MSDYREREPIPQERSATVDVPVPSDESARIIIGALLQRSSPGARVVLHDVDLSTIDPDKVRIRVDPLHGVTLLSYGDPER